MYPASLKFGFKLSAEELLQNGPRNNRYFDVLLETKDALIALDLKSLSPAYFDEAKSVILDPLKSDQEIKQMEGNFYNEKNILEKMSVQTVLDRTIEVFHKKYKQKLQEKAKNKSLFAFVICNVGFNRVVYSKIDTS